jgi:hypothetical protein
LPAPLGPGQPVPQRAYREVLQAYQKAALDALDRTVVSASDRELIKQYFSSLGGTP